jgi:hypothetical protein
LLELHRFYRKLPGVLDLAPFQNLALRGGFRLVKVQLIAQPLPDPIERALERELGTAG